MGATNMLSPGERVRLHKIVRMMESPHEGERSNATTILLRAARERKLTMPELLVWIVGVAPHTSAASSTASSARERSKPPPPPPPRQPRHDYSKPDAIQMLIEILDSGRSFPSHWEMDFLASLRQKLIRWGPRLMLSEKQAAVIERIYETL